MEKEYHTLITLMARVRFIKKHKTKPETSLLANQMYNSSCHVDLDPHLGNIIPLFFQQILNILSSEVS